MSAIIKASTIHDDGSAKNGYFIKEWFAGFILGTIVCSCINLGFDLIGEFAKAKKEENFKKQNYIIPKTSAKGLYLQLEDGKLYKKQ